MKMLFTVLLIVLSSIACQLLKSNVGLISHRFSRLLKPEKIVMVGLDNVDKYNMLRIFKLSEIENSSYDNGFEIYSVKTHKISIFSWNLFDNDEIRDLWRQFYQNTSGIIFLLDSNDRNRINEARDELQKMLNEDSLKDVPLIVFANSQDLPDEIKSEEIAELLELNSIRVRKWKIQKINADSQKGIYEGVDWLLTTITQKLKK
jgi:GTPase SAR1 family protein